MRLRLFTQVLTGLTIIISLTATLNQLSYATGITFYCNTSKNVPITFARILQDSQQEKDISVIRWVSNNYFPSEWTPERRCQEVSLRLQRNYDNGMLRYITTGKLNGEPVVCAATRKNAACTDRTLLFTLKRGTDANATLRRLIDRRALAIGNALNQNGCNTSNQHLNIDIKAFLDKAKNEQNNSSICEPTAEVSDTP